jgi:integrating conjugative element protein (TIGR03752 family)
VAGGGRDIPAGLGFEPGTAMPANLGSGEAGMPAPPAYGGAAPGGGVVWIEPLGQKSVMGQNGQMQLVKASQLPDASTGTSNQGAGLQPMPMPDGSAATGLATMAGDPGAAPGGARKAYFTIPENAVLMDSSAMTALIGRIPVGGNVRDPMEFKVLIGRHNLAANGFSVPSDVTGMMVSGVAVGDWMLSCVEGHINSVTFIFQDGSIRTVSRRGGGQASGNNNSQRLGFITDERGAPCISGEKITNAPMYLTQVVGMKTLEVAARAAAVAQTTTTSSPQGNSTTSVTGDSGKFILGQAAAGGVDEVSNWLMKRLNDSFDAIYVKPGLRVAVHINEAILIDKEPNNRRLDHGRPNRGITAQRGTHAHLD